MTSAPRPIHWLVWGGLAAIVLAIAGVFFTTLFQQKSAPLPQLGAIPDFRLTNQLNQVVTAADLRGFVWVADIIFTRCPGPCAEMTRKMKAIQDRLPVDGKVRLVSLTADPDYDTPEILRQYGERFKANSNTWSFLTGPKPALYELAMKGLKLAVEENTGSGSGQEPFIHSTRFVVIDQQGQLRAVSVEGTEPNAPEKVIQIVHQLLRQ